MTKGRIGALAAAGLLAMTVSACGKSEDASSAAAGSESSDTPIKIGVTIEKTGPVPTLGNALKGVEAAAKHLNEQGGIAGRQVELVVRDNAADPSKAVTHVREFEQSGIKVVLGGAFGASCNAIAPVAAKADLVDFCISTDDLPEADDHMFGIGPGYTVTINDAVRYLQSEGEKSAIFAEKAKSGDTSALVAEDVAKEIGFPIVVVRTEASATTLKPQIQKAMSEGVDTMWFTQCSPIGVTGAQEAIGLGFKGKIMLENCNGSLDVAKAVKEFANDQVVIQAPWFIMGDFTAPEGDPRAEAVKTYNDAGNPPDLVVAAGWDALHLAAAAIEKAGTTDTDKLVETLEADFEYTGLWHRGTMTADDHRGAVGEGALEHAYFTADGKIEPLK